VAEQISRRANRVTSAVFDAPFETQIVRFGHHGLNLKDSLDAMEGWSILTNIWHEHEGEATVRPGETTFATLPAASTVHSIRKLRDPHAGTTTRLWGAGTSLSHGATGATSVIDTGFSGDPLALVPHRPPFSGAPWMFVGDRTKMVKVRADGLVLPIGLPIPIVAAVTAIGTQYRRSICLGNATDSTAAIAWTGAAGGDEQGNATDVPAVPTDTASSPAGYDLYFITNPGSIVTTYDSWWGAAITRDLTELDAITPLTGEPATVPASDDDIIHLWMKLSHPQLVEEVRVYIVVSATFSETPRRSSRRTPMRT
jgi:hypothetical protein